MSLYDLIRDLRTVQRAINIKAPREIASVMEENKNKNFKDEGYGEDGLEKWPERLYENSLNYPKLDYKGSLKRSWKKSYQEKQARLYSNNPLAKLHQEGGRTNQRKFIRKPPASTHEIYAKITKVPARPMVGVGRRTYKRAYIILKEPFEKYFK